MSNLPSVTPRELVKILVRRGYVLDRTKGSHQIYLHPINEKRIIVPMHCKDLPIGTLLEIIKQAGISKEEL